MKIVTWVVSLSFFLIHTIGETTLIIQKNSSEGIHFAIKEDLKSQFKGFWINENPETRSITKIKIGYKNNKHVVQMWGACSPQDCNWGENVSDIEDKDATEFTLLWDQDYAESKVTYELVDSKLKITNVRHYKDNSNREDITMVEYFVMK